MTTPSRSTTHSPTTEAPRKGWGGEPGCGLAFSRLVRHDGAAIHTAAFRGGSRAVPKQVEGERPCLSSSRYSSATYAWRQVGKPSKGSENARPSIGLSPRRFASYCYATPYHKGPFAEYDCIPCRERRNLTSGQGA